MTKDIANILLKPIADALIHDKQNKISKFHVSNGWVLRQTFDAVTI